MAYENLKTAIKQVIKQNGNQEITGQLLQSTLINIVNIIGNSGVVFKGVINSTSTPEVSENPIFYINEISRSAQTFSNFGGLKTEKNELAIFIKDSNDTWTKLHIGHMHVQPEVTTSDIAAAAVVSTKLANGAVTSAKIDNSAVDETKIKDESVTLNKLARTVRSSVNNIPYIDKRSLSTSFNIGYFECDTEANNASKAIYNSGDGDLWPSPTSSELRSGGTMRIKMKYATTANNTFLSIRDSGTDTEMFRLLMFYKDKPAGPVNTWADKEVIEGYWDRHFNIFYARPWYKQIETSDIAVGAVASTKLANGAVTSSKIAFAAVEANNIKDGSVTKIKLNDELATKIGESLSFKGIALNDANKALTSGIYPIVTENIPITGETFIIQTLRTVTAVYNQYVSTQIAIGTTGTTIGKVYIRKNIQKSGAYTFGDWIDLTADINITDTVYEHVAQQVTDGAWIPIKAGRNSEGNIIEGAVSEGKETITNAEYAHAEGLRTVATGTYSHAEGDNTTALNNSSHSEGNNTKANGDCSHAEGYRSVATGNYSHAEGCDTQAISYGSHAEGYQTQASSSYSHSEGYQTKALGFCSHAEGYVVSAKGNFAHAEGIYNYDSNDFIKALGVGNSEDNRVNVEVVYVKRGENGVPISSDPKNGYKYILGIGGYTGKAITEGMKSVQEVISDLESRIATLEEKLKS